MKRTGNIYQKITELSNIEAAIYKASKGKSGRNSVEKILDSPTYYALQIQKSLKDKTYRPSPYVDMKYTKELINRNVLFISHVSTQIK